MTDSLRKLDRHMQIIFDIVRCSWLHTISERRLRFPVEPVRNYYCCSVRN
jgi:hypothetical protein